MSHLDEGTIHAWLDGELPLEEAARVEAHAKECAECAALVAEARGFIAGSSRIVSSLDIVRGNVIPAAAVKKPATQRSVWKRLKLTPARAAIAATILVGVASTFAVRRQDDHLASPMNAAALPASAPGAAPAPAATIVSKSALNPVPERIAPQRRDSVAKPTVMARSEAVRDAARDAAAEQPKAIAPAAPSALAGAGVAMSSAGAPPAAASTAADARSAKASAAEPQINALNRAANVGAMAPRAFSRERTAPVSPEGCYEILQRPTAPDLHGFPMRFQLGRDSASNSVVRPLVLPGQFDRALDGATWQALPGNSIVITVASPRGGAMELRFVPGDTLMQMTDVGRSLPIRFATRACGS